MSAQGGGRGLSDLDGLETAVADTLVGSRGRQHAIFSPERDREAATK